MLGLRRFVISGLVGALLATVLNVSIEAAAEFPPGTPAQDLPVGVAWGYNGYGGLGDGTTTKRTAPVAISSAGLLGEVDTVVNGREHSCGIAKGKAACWGRNQWGQLGSVGPDSPVPVAVPLAGTVTAISAADVNTCAIADGKVYCWGMGGAGQLGNGEISNTIKPPTLVAGILAGRTVTAISAAQNHTCAIADGQAFCWGTNQDGRLGTGNGPAKVATPVAVSIVGPLEGKTITAISAGQNHTCALAAGKAYCWGNNDYGQIGDNTGDGPRLVPVAVHTAGILSGKTVTSISAGVVITCVTAINSSSSQRKAYCWGRNSEGETGSGSNSSEVHAPVAVSTPGALATASVSSISTRGQGGCLIANGQGYCWGSNATGQLGSNFAGAYTLAPGTVTKTPVIATRRFVTVATGLGTASGVAVKPRVFTDIPAAHTFYDDITWLAGRGVTQGYGDDTFQPNGAVTRQAMSAFLFRYVKPGVPTPTCDPNVPRVFSDVSVKTAFCGAIEWMVAAKIVPAAKSFQPTAGVTRGVLADWHYRAHHPGLADQTCAGNVFADVTMNTTSCGNIEWFAQVGVTAGYADNTFKPGLAVTRGAMSAFMHRASELESH